METGKEDQAVAASSYRYWVREVKEDAAPLPVPRKLTPQEDNDSINKSSGTRLGSVWNSAGTWEEKNLNKWASDRIKELLETLWSLEFSEGKAEKPEVSKCVGDAYLVTVRNKKRVGYTYELTLKVKGEWTIGEEKKAVKGHLEIPEFSFGEVDDLQDILDRLETRRKKLMEVKLTDDKDLLQQDKVRIRHDLKKFLLPVREKLLQFEQELKDR